ncbi:MAG: polyprenyl synthetase family protein [Rhodospirillaceae bacterium]|nr:polyprenyl synthetase family protein [Rhodospirillaceae bacterium]
MNTLDKLTALVTNDLTLVNKVITKRVHNSINLIPQLSSYIINSGGKRLRPILTLAASKLCNYQGNRHINLAACIEFIHTATLLHDDVVDDSLLRRGLISANTIWGNKSSILVGDFMLSQSLELIVEDGNLQVLEILAHAFSVISEGEILHLSTSNDIYIDKNSYFKIIRSKTATLFAAACQIGAIISNCSNDEELALKNYGINLGIVFQLIDDALDYSAKQKQFGKTLGNDFYNGKITLPMILAFHRSNDKEQEFLFSILKDSGKFNKKTDLIQILHLMEKYKCLEDTIKSAHHYSDIARDALSIFQNSAIKSAMISIIDFCINRKF